ncbi:MAG: hypothetical protein E7639_02170 [Ruminococcaceae bacterium]|nr:hypothetical protein [Oscillospiraceae bacterium]
MHFNRVFLCLFCFLLALTGTACGTQATAASMADTRSPENTQINFLDTLTFLGDSTTAHMATRAPFGKSGAAGRVWMTKSRYLNLSPRITYERILCPESGEELTIAEVAARIKPQRLVITLGIDYGVYYYRNDQTSFEFYYEKLLDAILAESPDTTLVLQSIFPVGRQSRAITNEMVDKANETVATIAKRRGLVFVDANRILKDHDGFLAQEYCYSDDGIHLTAAAYDAIFKNLENYEQEITRSA